MNYDNISPPSLNLSADHDFGAIALFSNKFLGAVSRGEVDIKALLKLELEQRGYDENGNWVGPKKKKV